MPEYLAPGVYVEEVSFRSKSIEGVSTTTTGFVGPARYGPIDIQPELVTSLVEFDRVYGDQGRLAFSDGVRDNWLRHAARAFFEEGGKRLYVSRIYNSGVDFGASPPDPFVGNAAPQPAPLVPYPVNVRARFPGIAGNGRVTIRLDLTPNRFVTGPGGNAVRATLDRDVAYIAGAGIAEPGFYLALWDNAARAWTFFKRGTGGGADVTLAIAAMPPTATVQTVTATVTADPDAPGMPTYVAEGLALDARHTRAGSPDSLFAHFGPHARGPGSTSVGPDPSKARTIPVMIDTATDDGLAVLGRMGDFSPPSTPPGPEPDGLLAQLVAGGSAEARTIAISLVGGNDGAAPQPLHYQGAVDGETDLKTGLVQFEDLEDISIVAAPGATEYPGPDAQAATGMLISHAERMRYRIAVLEAPRNSTLAEVRDFRARFDSSHAALYYPWVSIIDPLTNDPGTAPPAGFVAGIYARNDIERAVYKAPANEVINLAIGFERPINKAQQEVLNPEGINCLRYFEGRGYRVWGARTISSDPEWKYVNLRRYFAYLERSIDVGTQWSVFEPNGERLWANVKRTIDDFLLNEWTNGALLGDRPEKAYFVRCDRSTMTQNDLDNGRMIALIGVAALKPAEFVIFRIGQWTADRRN